MRVNKDLEQISLKQSNINPLVVRSWESNKGRPAETINTKVSGKVNLIFYKLNLFPIFLVDKVRVKVVICRIMKNVFTITADGVTQCEFSINMQISVESFNSESRCATSFIA